MHTTRCELFLKTVELRWSCAPATGANGGGQAPDQEEIAAFFHDFMDGYWDAFEEATSHDSDDLREIDRQILQLQEEISRALGPEHQDVLSRYECLANSRMTKELDHAFLIGYQTAIRLLFKGCPAIAGSCGR